MKNIKPVHNINGMFRMVCCATPKKNSSQKIIRAITIINMLLSVTAGSIQGLPVQSTERELPEDPSAKLKTN
jgi:hypothetical protein